MLRKKLVHVIHWPGSGITALVRDMIPFVDADGYDVHIILFNGDAGEIGYFRGAKQVHVLGFGNSPLRALFQLNSLLRDIRPDIIHAHHFQPFVWCSLLGGKGQRQLLISQSPALCLS